MKPISFWVLAIVFLLVNPLIAKASHIKAGTCVNLREEPDINSEVITCLPSRKNVEIVRRSRSGAFAWVKDSQDRLWYLVKVPEDNLKGWVAAQFIEL